MRRVIFLLFLVCFRREFAKRVKFSAIFSSSIKQLSYRAQPRPKGLYRLPCPFLSIFCIIDVIDTISLADYENYPGDYQSETEKYFE